MAVKNEATSTSKPEPPSELPPTTPAPDGGYGWIVTTSVAVVNGHSWGISAAYAVFLAHYLKNDTFAGATPLMYAAVGSLSVGVTLLLSPLVTIMARELGMRSTMLIGAAIQSTSLICASLSTRIWHLFMSQGLLFGVGMGLLFVPSHGIVPQWFIKRRALANGIAIAGAGLGGFTYSLAAGAIIESISLAWAYRFLAIVSAVANTCCTLLIKTRHGTKQARPMAFDISLLRRVDYLLILGFGALSMLGYFILIFTLANYANVIGLSSSRASMIPALFMLGQAVGRPCIGWLSDRFGRINVTFWATLIAGLFCLVIWVNSKSFGMLIFFALVEGLIAGVFWVNIAPVLADVIGLENLPSGLSILWVTTAIPSTLSTPIAIEIYQGTGSYLGAQLFSGFMFIGASVCMFCLRAHQIGRTAKGKDQSSQSANKEARPVTA